MEILKLYLYFVQHWLTDQARSGQKISMVQQICFKAKQCKSRQKKVVSSNEQYLGILLSDLDINVLRLTGLSWQHLDTYLDVRWQKFPDKMATLTLSCFWPRQWHQDNAPKCLLTSEAFNWERSMTTNKCHWHCRCYRWGLQGWFCCTV